MHGFKHFEDLDLPSCNIENVVVNRCHPDSVVVQLGFTPTSAGRRAGPQRTDDGIRGGMMP